MDQHSILPYELEKKETFLTNPSILDNKNWSFQIMRHFESIHEGSDSITDIK